MRQDKTYHSWTYEERDLFLEVLKQLGKQWVVIYENFFPNITVYGVRNYYYHFRRFTPEAFEGIDLDTPAQSFDPPPEGYNFTVYQESEPSLRFMPCPALDLSEDESAQQQLYYSFSQSDSHHDFGCGASAYFQINV